jgi:hypothetical protein
MGLMEQAGQERVAKGMMAFAKGHPQAEGD